MAIAWFNAQAFATTGNVPVGREFLLTLTYLGNVNADTNTATKTVTAPAGTGPVYAFGDAGWFLPQTMFGGGGPEPTLEVKSNWVGAAIYLEGADTGNVTPYIFDPAVAGTYTVVMPNITWTPASFAYAAEENETVTFMGEFTPGVATNPIPVDGATLTWADGVTDEVVLSWDPVADVSYYNVYWNGATAPVQANEPTFTTPVIGDGAYTWQIVPYVTDPAAPAKGVRKASPIAAKVNGNSTIRGGAVGAPVWGFTIEYAPVIVPTLTITSEPVGAAIYVGVPAVDTGEVTPFDFTVAGTYSVAMANYTFSPAEYVWDGLADHTENFVGTLEEEYDIDPDTPAVINPETEVTIAGDGFVGGTVVTGGLTPVPNPTFVATSEGILQLVGTGLVTITFDFDPAVDWFIYLEGGVWQVIAGPLSTYDVVVDLGAKDGSLEFKSGSGGDPTLPVELSVFNAVLTVNKFVELTWISESETNMLGYRVYRNESQEAASAICITPELIPASNTSSTRIYNLTDMEVVAGNTYYYWLEAADFGHSTMFGPQYVEVTAEETPVLPAHTVMNNAYPNPFKASTVTNINVNLKAGDHGSVTIYNVLGQVVKTYKVVEGINPLTWNGQDSRGNACGSGIYFYKLSTNSLNQTKKMVIVK
ncbi:MAG: T9SS type A sorting domain-containing protein [Candidatus Cloacimonetes bacterium]|nr:T9SS type A sorting domain-containing protein [Candidatus Cloacimonadota bacterium]